MQNVMTDRRIHYLPLALVVCLSGVLGCRSAMDDFYWPLADSDESVSAGVRSYINRLSDFLFVASRYVNDKGARDVLWVPGANR